MTRQHNRSLRSWFSHFFFWRIGPLTIAIWVGIWIGGVSLSTSSISYAAYELPVDTQKADIETLKADLVDRLFECEAAGHSHEEGLVTIDNNAAGSLKGDDVFSYGLGQWKTDSIIAEVKSRDGIEITPKEAKELAWDTPRAKSLALYTIFDNPTGKGIDHWHNCNIKNDFAIEVAILKRLSR